MQLIKGSLLVMLGILAGAIVYAIVGWLLKGGNFYIGFKDGFVLATAVITSITAAKLRK
ncbi:hypothetical protein [Bartonella sp. DGB1]|uniref:hypothetical protein n=1 Tax=Bartonella sp. DGB1 TaxID=3239807 RepID=UPI0035236EA1